MNLDKWIPENLGNNIESEVGCKPFRAKKFFNQSVILLQFCLLNPDMGPKMVNSEIKGSRAALKILKPISIYSYVNVQNTKYAYNMNQN